MDHLLVQPPKMDQQTTSAPETPEPPKNNNGVKKAPRLDSPPVAPKCTKKWSKKQQVVQEPPLSILLMPIVMKFVKMHVLCS